MCIVESSRIYVHLLFICSSVHRPVLRMDGEMGVSSTSELRFPRLVGGDWTEVAPERTNGYRMDTEWIHWFLPNESQMNHKWITNQSHMNHTWITHESWIHDFGWLWMAWWCFMCQMSSVRLSYGNWNAIIFYGGSFQRKLACGWCATSRCSISILVIPMAMQPALGLISLKYCRTVSNTVDLSDLNCNLRGSFWNLAWPAWNRRNRRKPSEDMKRSAQAFAKVGLLSVC